MARRRGDSAGRPLYGNGKGTNGTDDHRAPDARGGREELERVVCTAADGRFSAALQGRPGSYASYALLCEGEGETASCHGLLFGEVWLASGQSNMEFVLRSCADRDRADALYSPYIRYLNCAKPADAADGGEVARAVYPLEELSAAGWRAADSMENAGNMSGVAFFMAAALSPVSACRWG